MTARCFERRLQVGPPVLAQQVAVGLIRKLLERLHRIARQVERLPRLLVEFDELAPDIGAIFGHSFADPGRPTPARSYYKPWQRAVIGLAGLFILLLPLLVLY
jgi:hypothetical protein